MFIKNILKAFAPETKIEAYLGHTLLDYGTVKEFMNSGLMAYTEVDKQNLFYIKDNKIIIYIKYED